MTDLMKKRVRLIGGPNDGETMNVLPDIAVIALERSCPDCGQGGAVYSLDLKPGDDLAHKTAMYFQSFHCVCGSVSKAETER